MVSVFYKTLLALVILSTVLSVDAYCAPTCLGFFSKQAWSVSPKHDKGLSRIKRNNFNTERTLTDYRKDFEGKFFGILKNFNRPSQSWIDMGAGSALAQTTFLNRLIRTVPRADWPQLRPLSYAIPSWSLGRIRKLENLYPDIFKYTEGLQTPQSIREMKPADLITDNTSLVQYADSIGLDGNEFVKAYIDITKSGGQILVSSYTEEKLAKLPKSYRKQLEIVEIVTGDEISPFLYIKKR